MDPNDAFSATLFKWDHHRAPAAPSPPPPHRSLLHSSNPTPTIPPPQPPPPYCHPKELDVLESFFQHYGIRYFTLAKMAELGFTLNTLLNMKDEELDEMIGSLAEIFRWDLLVGERYGIKAAIRAERRRVEDESRHRHFVAATAAAADTNNPLDALSQEGLSEEPVQQEKEAAGSGSGAGGVVWDVVAEGKKQRRRRAARGSEDDDGSGGERQREHPFIVTEPGEVARGKKNGLDYLFHLYEQCRNFLIEVQNLAKERGEKCPTKVTNQVFRYAKKAGASYINKPKMRHYVHCYALHCLDEEASNRLRRAFKERGENVGAWRQACYQPLVAMAARQGWDIDAIFNNHHRLSIWYVPTKLRQLCHMERSNAAAVAVAAVVAPLPAK